MAVTWVGGREFTHQTSNTSISSTLPASLQDGDGVFFVVFGRSTLNTPAGWTKVLESDPFGSLNQRVALFRKDTVLSSNSNASVTFTQASAGRIGLIGWAIRGANPAPNVYSPTNHTVSNFSFELTRAQSPSNGAMGVTLASTYLSSSSVWTPTLLNGGPATRFSGSSSELRLAGFYRALSSGVWFPAGMFDEEFVIFGSGSTSNNGFTVTLIFEEALAGLIGTAEGFSSTNFGTPVRAGHEASGFSTTAFGTAGVGNFFPAKSFETGVPTLEYALTEIDGVAITGSFVTRAPNGTWLVGTRTASDFGAVATSADAVSWVTTSVSRNHDAAIRPGDGLCILPAFGAFRSSTNYSSWATETVTGYETVDMASVCWTGTNFRAIGSNWDCFGSTGDGTWTRIAATGLGGFFSTARIRSGNGVLLLGTVNGLLRRSTNGGTSWSSVTSQFGASAINDLHYDAATTTWMAVGASGKVSTSTNDGATWIARNTGIASTLYGVSKVGSKWVVVGAGGVVLESEDTVAWDVSSGAFGSKIVRAIGASGDEAVLYADGALIGHATTNAEGERVSLMGDFGVPEMLTSLLTSLVAQGVRSIRFGRPTLFLHNIVYVPWKIPDFGQPQLGFTEFLGEASGWVVGFGVPVCPEGLPDTSIIGEPTITFSTTHSTTHVLVDGFGNPASPTDTVGEMWGFSDVVFGTPGSNYPLDAQGSLLIDFGMPSTQFDSICVAEGFAETHYGSPRFRPNALAVGFNTVQFGTPIEPTHRVTGALLSRFGRPRLPASPYRTFGFTLHGRFGQPTGFWRLYPTTSTVLGAFGSPKMFAANRAFFIPPETRFGRPIARKDSC